MVDKEVDFLLVSLPYDRLQGRYRGYLPLGLARLAGALSETSVRAAIYNADAPRQQGEAGVLRQSALWGAHEAYLRAVQDENHPVWEEVSQTLARTRPRAVGITVWTEKLQSARTFSRISKRVLPSTPVIWGGPHPTARPRECLEYPEVDLVVRGEGERTVAELAPLLMEGGDPSAVPGVFTLDEKSGEVMGTERSLEQDLDSLPSPAWDAGLTDEDWPHRSGGRQYLITSRGCPYKCNYCSACSMWGRKARFLSVEKTMEEIHRIVRLTGSRYIDFWDDSFTLNRKRTQGLCEALIDSGLGVRWTCLTRVDLIDAPLLRLMKKSGCRAIAFGIETASPRMLKLLDKGVTIEDVNRGIAMCKQAHVRVTAYYMIGFPDETEEDIALTVEHMRTRGASQVAVSLFTPYPGSSLFDNMVERGLLREPFEWERTASRHRREEHFTVAIPQDRFREIAVATFREADRVNMSLARRLRRRWERLRQTTSP